MHMRCVLLFILFCSGTVSAESWTSHVSHNSIQSIAFEGDYVWCAATGGVTRWDKRNGVFLNYSKRDGLVSDDVRAVAVGSSGRKWFGTSAGVSVFDGASWTTYNTGDGLADDEVRVIEIAPDGRVWVGSAFGISVFDGETWRAWTEGNASPGPSRSLRDVSSIAFGANGVVWCTAGYYDGPRQVLWSFDGASWQPEGVAKTVRTDGAGNVWYTRYVGFTVDSLDRYSGTACEYPGYTGTAREYTDLSIDRNNTVWLIRRHAPVMNTIEDIVWYDGSSWGFVDRPGWLGGSMKTIRTDAGRVVWVGADEGLFSFDGGKWKHFLQGLAHNQISDGVIDRDNILWAVSRNAVATYDGVQWESYADEDDFLRDYPITSIAVDDRNVKWFGTEAGIVRFDGLSWSLIPYPEEEPGMYAETLAVDHSGTLWCTYTKEWRAYIASYDGSEWLLHSNENLLAANWARDIVVDREDRKWVCTNKGLARYDGREWTLYEFPDGNTPSGIPYSGYCDPQGALCFVYSSHLCCFDGETWQIYRLPGTESIRSIARDRNGILWLGSLDGVTRFDGESWQTLTPADGLVNGTVNLVLVDENNTKWFGTLGGFSEYRDNTTVVSGEKDQPEPLSFITYPNPFNPSTTLSFTLPAPENATLTVYDVTGRKVTDLLRGFYPAGNHSTLWNAKGCASGVYFAVLKTGERTETRKMLLVR